MTTKESARRATARWRAKNPERVIESNRASNLRRYGITQEQYDVMLEKQGGGCGICRTVPDGQNLAIDHDHTCCPSRKSACGACVRGLLCSNCNNGLGRFTDDINLLSRAVLYLDKRL